MEKYKITDVENGQGVFLSVNLKGQLLPGSFDHMLDELIGGKIDVSGFDTNYRNDKTGVAAVPPSTLVKLIISSRWLWDMGRNTIADFISRDGEKFKEVFAKVPVYCAELALVGGQTFAIDGLRLPSNASLNLTGTAEGLKKRLTASAGVTEQAGVSRPVCVCRISKVLSNHC